MPRSPMLQRLLDSQSRPFQILDAAGTVVGLNRAWGPTLGIPPPERVGAPCCPGAPSEETECRHRRFFRDLEPYVETLTLIGPDGSALNVQAQGFPLMDEDGTLYLGESLQPLGASVRAEGMVGRSPAFETLRQRLMQAAASEAPVLLKGETGTGKELAAELVHAGSRRSRGPFVVVDCTVLNEDLFESELFGHVKGAFTGAGSSKTGLFELADGGTLFLDEIGELPLSQQPKLLRALETGRFRPVGATAARSSDVRVVSATHRDLGAMVEAGEFRRDLYFRLAVLPLDVPPLRQRREDIPLLAEHLLQQIGKSSGREYRIQRETLRKLLLYRYPGNIRELRNLLHLGATLCENGNIGPEHIHLPEPERPEQAPVSLAAAPGHGLSPVENAEADYILNLLRRHGGSRKQVAASMNVSERTLYRKLKRYGLNRTDDQPLAHH